jgi:hypothetical protein
MRNIIPILFVAATVLAGCHSPSMVHTQTAAPAPFHPMFITTRGTNTSPDGIWRVGVSAAGDSLDLSPHQSLKGEGWTDSVWITDSPQGWKANAGWFVFIETESRVWAYDGDSHLSLLAVTPTWGTWYGPSRFPCAVPTEVLSRLSELAPKAIHSGT